MLLAALLLKIHWVNDTIFHTAEVLKASSFLILRSDSFKEYGVSGVSEVHLVYEGQGDIKESGYQRGLKLMLNPNEI